MRQAARSLLAAAAAAAAAHYGLRAARAKAAAAAGSDGVLAEERWGRVNHRGEPVTLLEGPVYAAAAAAGVLAAPGLDARLRAAGVVAALGAGGFGVYDDLCGSADRRGIKGHVTALVKQGEVTTGAVKIAGIGAVGVLGGCLARRGTGVVDKALAAVLIAGAANAVNLLDLRPGRAIKGAAFAAVPGVLRRAAFNGASGRASAGASTGGSSTGAANTLALAGLAAAAALLPEDLGERAMLGDAGANALGALLGTAAAAGARSAGALAWRAAAVTALTLASEKVSFTRVIAAYPPLNAIDLWGRRPPAQQPSPAADAENSVAAPAAESGPTPAPESESTPETASTLAGPEPASTPASAGPAAMSEPAGAFPDDSVPDSAAATSPAPATTFPVPTFPAPMEPLPDDSDDSDDPAATGPDPRA